MDGVPQKRPRPAEAALVDQLKLQPHTIREEPFSGTDDLRAEGHFETRRQDQPLARARRTRAHQQ